jgi:hypothetical protein
LDPALAPVELAVYLGFHLKTLGVAVSDEPVNSSNTAATPGVFSFFRVSALRKPGDFAYSKTRERLRVPRSMSLR